MNPDLHWLRVRHHRRYLRAGLCGLQGFPCVRGDPLPHPADERRLSAFLRILHGTSLRFFGRCDLRHTYLQAWWTYLPRERTISAPTWMLCLQLMQRPGCLAFTFPSHSHALWYHRRRPTKEVDR